MPHSRKKVSREHCLPCHWLFFGAEFMDGREVYVCAVHGVVLCDGLSSLCCWLCVCCVRALWAQLVLLSHR